MDSDNDAVYNNWLSGFGPNIWTVYGGFEGYMRTHGYSDPDRKGIGLRYKAMHVPIWENFLGRRLRRLVLGRELHREHLGGSGPDRAVPN